MVLAQDLPLNFDPIALMVAAIALMLAVRESRRNGSALISLSMCKYHGIQSIIENRGQPFGEFRIQIRNEGVTLFRPSMSLGFRPLHSGGWINFPIKRDADPDKKLSEDFARRMVSEFRIKSYELSPDDRKLLTTIKNVRLQETRIQVFSQGHRVCEFRAGGILDRLAMLWNRIAHKVNWSFSHKVKWGPKRIQLFSFPQIVPRFTTIEDQLREFIQCLERPEGHA